MWRAEHSWSHTTPGLLYHMTAVGLQSVPRNSPNTKQRQVQSKLCWISPPGWEWTTAHQEEERCIEWKLTMQSTQCNAAQRNVMQCTPPPGVLVPFTVFLQCISSLNPKISCRMHAPYNSKITGTMLGIRSPGPPSRDVFLAVQDSSIGDLVTD